MLGQALRRLYAEELVATGSTDGSHGTGGGVA
jgi:hypothetical protein